LSRFETQILSEPDNLDKLVRLNDAWGARAGEQTKSWRIILDLDSSESPVHGEQEGFQYPIRLSENPVLQRQIEPLLSQPVDWDSDQRAPASA